MTASAEGGHAPAADAVVIQVHVQQQLQLQAVAIADSMAQVDVTQHMS